jgi:FkbM family methyltransferase
MRIVDILYRVNLKLLELSKRFSRIRFIYSFTSSLLSKYNGLINTRIHGVRVKINNGYTYPITVRRFNNFNSPLIDLIGATAAKFNRKLVIVDVGSATGDTALLILKNLDPIVSELYCIDGDREFFNQMKYNLREFQKTRLFNVVLSANSNNKVSELVRIHGGTASAQGNIKVESMSLDDLIMNNGLDKIDILKIDVDGYDGEILKGAINLMSKDKVKIIFEWHPKLILETKNAVFEVFDLLKDMGYNCFLWFDKFGNFSHISSCAEKEILNYYFEFCLNSVFDEDWHYDIIALIGYDKEIIEDILKKKFSKNRISKY